MKNKSFILLIVLVFTGLLLRIEGIITETFAFTYDVGRDLLKVKEIVETFNVPFIGPTTGVPGLFYGPWWYYFLIIPFILSGGDPRGLVLFIALTGVVSIVVSYLIGREAGSKLYGILFASYITVSATLISITSQIWNPNIIPLLVLLILYLLIIVFVNKGNAHPLIFIGIGLLMGLVLDSEIVYGVLFIIGLIITLIIYRSIVSKRFVLFSLLGFLLILLPRLLFEIKNNFIMTLSVLKFIKTGRDGSGSTVNFQPIESFKSQWQLFIDSVAGGYDLLGILLAIFAITMLIKYWKKLDNKLAFLTKTMIIQIIVFFIGLSFFFEAIWSHYLIGMPIVYIGLTSLAFYIAIIKFKDGRIFLHILFLILILLNMHVPSKINRLISPVVLNDPAQYAVAKQVVDYVYKSAQGEPFKYILYTPPVHDFTYSYLFSWYGNKTYGYVPQEDDIDFFYVIIEPDRQYPDRITKWLEDREEDGRVVSETTLDGNIIIQTRDLSSH